MKNYTVLYPLSLRATTMKKFRSLIHATAPESGQAHGRLAPEERPTRPTKIIGLGSGRKTTVKIIQKPDTRRSTRVQTSSWMSSVQRQALPASPAKICGFGVRQKTFPERVRQCPNPIYGLPVKLIR